MEVAGRTDYMIRALVVYYSRTGYTRRIAEEIVRALACDICPIQEEKARHGLLGYMRSAYEAVRHEQPPIAALARDPSQYDLVVIGTPVWGWSLSSPVRAFAQRYRDGLAHVAFFCTMGGSGAGKTFGELQQVTGRMPIATLGLTDGEIDAQTHQQKVDRFAAKLQELVTR
jgi:menaquinone-dependent protoporphyrinogen IX oxidase